MAEGARGGPMKALLLLAVALTICMGPTQGQQISLAACRNFQSSPKFTADYLAKMTAVEEGYALLLTSDRPRTSGCQQINFYSNGTFYLSYRNDYEAMVNHTGKFTVQEATFTQPGFIELNVPVSALGTGLGQNVRLNIIVAEDDYFVAATCEQIGIFAVELVHAFTPVSMLRVNASADLNATLALQEVPQFERLREVNQACFAVTRGTPSLSQIYNFLVKLGILPALPFISDTTQRQSSQFYSALPSLAAYPGYPNFSPIGGPVQSIAYGPVQGFSAQIPVEGQAHANFYTGQQASLAYPSVAVPYQTQGANTVPAVSYKYQSPGMNFQPVDFSSQTPGVNYISATPNSIPTPSGGFGSPAVYSQQAGFQASGSPLFSQASGMNYDVQSRGASSDAYAVSDHSTGIAYDPEAFNIGSSVVSQDPAAFGA